MELSLLEPLKPLANWVIETIGTRSLPLNISVEIDMIVKIKVEEGAITGPN